MKRIVSLLLIAAAVLTMLTGCSNVSGNSGNNSIKVTEAPASGNKPGDGNTESGNSADNAGISLSTMEPTLVDGRIEAGSCLYWDTFRMGGGSTEEGATFKVFTDYKAFEEAFASANIGRSERYNEEAFEKIFVVAVFYTVRSGGYSFGLNSGRLEDGKVNIDVNVQAPASGSIVTAAFETHCVLAAFASKAIHGEPEVVLTINDKSPADHRE